MNKIVTDGTRVFKNYQWNQEKEIVNKLTGKILKGDKSQNYCNYCFYQSDGKFRREKTVLLKASFPELFQPEHKQLYMDVFGMEDMFCFQKSNPNIVWSKSSRKFIKLGKTSCGHLFFAPKKNEDKWAKQKYIHVMVWQSYNKKKYDGKKFNIHHISFSKEQNENSNLMLLPSKYHHSFHNFVKMFQNNQISLEKVVKTINSYKISTEDKQRLKNSLNLLKTIKNDVLY